MNGLPFLSGEDRHALQRLRKASPERRELAFVTFVLALDKDLSRDFRAADLRGYELRGQDLGGIDLTGSDLRGADLRDVRNLTGEGMLLEGALVGKGGTRAPTDPPSSWLTRWETLLGDAQFEMLEVEVSRILEEAGRAWSEKDMARARSLLTDPGLRTVQEAPLDRPMFSFGINSRWGRMDE